MPGVEIAAAEPDRIAVKTLALKAELPNGVEAIGPLVSIEPETGVAPPQRIRMRLPEEVSLDAEREKRLSLACYSVSFSTSHKTLSGAWYTHTAKYDPARRTVEAAVSHASVWLIVNPDKLPYEILTNHFRIHVPVEVSETTAAVAAHALEKSYTQLESFGLRAGRGKTNRLDVYFLELSRKDDNVVYAGHRLTTTGGSYLVLNLPSRIPNFSLEELRASAGHEVFHEFQFKYQNINTFLDIWIPGLRKADLEIEKFLDTHSLKEEVYKLKEYNYPFGWLNEALSTWYQLKCAPNWTPQRGDPLYGWSKQFLIGGLVHINKSDVGYGGAVFIDYIVARFGTTVLREILEACRRQGRNRNPVAALKEACLKIAVARQDPSMVVFDDVWFHFASNLLLEDAKPPFNSRLNRNKLTTQRRQPRTIMVGDAPIRTKLTVWVRPLGMQRQGFRILKKGSPPSAKIVCEIRQLPTEDQCFPTKTALYYATGKPGPRAPLPAGSACAGTLNDESPSQTIMMTLDKAHPHARLEMLAVGLQGDKGSKADADLRIDYELTFTPVDDGPKDVDTFFPEVKYFPGYHGPWQVSKGKISDGTTGELRSVNRTYFYRQFVQGGPPKLLHILRVVVEIKEATPLAKDAFEAKLKALKADKRVVGLRNARVTGKSAAFAMKGIKEYYDKAVQTRDVVVFQEDRNLVEVSWSSFKPGEPWANRRDMTLEMANEVARRIRGTFRPVLPNPPGGDAMGRGQADASNLRGPEGARAVAIYGLSLAHASTQRFHEPWFDQIVALQAEAEKEAARLAATARTIKPLIKIPARYADADAVIEAMQKRKELLDAKKALSKAEKIEMAKYDERLAAVERVADAAFVVEQIERILFPSGKVQSHSGEVGDSLLKSLGALRLWPDRLNSPDPRRAGDAKAVTAAKEKLWHAAREVDTVEERRSHMKSYARVAEKAVRISKLQDHVATYNAAVEAYIKRIEAGDYRSCMAAAPYE